MGIPIQSPVENLKLVRATDATSDEVVRGDDTRLTGALQKTGGVMSGTLEIQKALASISGTASPLRIMFPGGAAYRASGSSITGAIKVTLPNSWSNTFINFTIKVFDFYSGESFEINVAGYDYITNSVWINCSAYIIGQVNRNFTVRFGHDGTKCCIYIGELASTWSYPQVFVVDFEAGYTGSTINNWDDGWVVGFEASAFGTITQTISNVQVGRYVDGKAVFAADADGNLKIEKATPKLILKTSSVTGDTEGMVSFENTSDPDQDVELRHEVNDAELPAMGFGLKVQKRGGGGAAMLIATGDLYGQSNKKVVYTDDSRLSDARIPVAHIHAKTDVLTLASNIVLGRYSANGGAVEEITCTAAGRALLDDADAAAQRSTLGLGDSATKNVGTTAGTVAAGDDSRFSNALNLTTTFTAGEALASGDLCHLKSDGKMWKAANYDETLCNGKLAIANASISANASGSFVVFGNYTTSGLTVGDTYYVDEIFGEITNVKPTGAGQVIRIIGYAISATVLEFTPSAYYSQLDGEDFVTEWQTTTPNKEITLPLYAGNSATFDCTIDWGDSSALTEVTDANYTTARVHTYATAGTYQIKINGICEGWSFRDVVVGSKTELKKVITFGSGSNFAGFKYLEGGFENCTYMVSLGESGIKPSFRGSSRLTSLYGCFDDCDALTSISANIFKKCQKVTTFSRCFAYCAFTSAVPTDLFKYNIDATDFSQCFLYCSSLSSVPANLFRYNTNVTTFADCFYGCSALQINKNIFYADGEQSSRFYNKSVQFNTCFSRTSFSGTQGEAPDLWNCTFGTGTPTKTDCFNGAGNSTTSLSNYTSIPADWL